MRGTDNQQSSMFSYISAERRVPRDHPLRAIRTMADTALGELSASFERMYAVDGRPSIAPEKLMRALLLQVLYTVRSERQLMEQLDYNLLFRWFVGLSMDDPVWDVTVFTKNRERLLRGDVAEAFFQRVLELARAEQLLSDEHFSVDGTLIQAWAGQKSFVRKGTTPPPPDDPGNPTVNFHGAGGVGGRVGDGEGDSRTLPGHARRRQALRRSGLCRVPPHAQRDAARGAEGVHRPRRADDPALGLRGESAVPQARRRSVRVAEDRGPAPPDSAPRTRARRLDVHLRGGGLQPGAAADAPGGGRMKRRGGPWPSSVERRRRGFRRAHQA